MSAELPTVFDAHLHPEGLSDQDLDTLRFFGVASALFVSHPAVAQPTPRSLREHFDALLGRHLPRAERAGIRAYAAVGLDPRHLPRRGLEEMLYALPTYLGEAKVVALGEVGLSRGGEGEEHAFVEQLRLGSRLKRPVLVHTPHQDKERWTRRTLLLVKESGIAPSRVLVDHTDTKTVRPVLACGHYAGLTVHPSELPAGRAVQLVRKLGSARLVLSSDAGEGASDLTAVARVAHLLAKAKLSRRVIDRVCAKNALAFYGIRPAR